MAEIRSVAVIGAGTMGHGIAQCCAMAGLDVRLVDVEQRFVDRGMDLMRTSLARFVASGKLAQDASDAALRRVTPTIAFDDAVRDVDVVVEAVPEVLDLKKDTFRRIAAVAKAGAVLTTNTSQFSITAIAASCDRPEDVIGMHFFNPAVLMRLVEIVRGLRTTDRTLEVALALTRRLGKESAVCRRDTVGFITSRALAAFRLECVRIYEEGIASLEDIDRAIRLAFNHPMGPFELNDFNGLDVGLYNAESLREAFGERFTPPQALVERVRAGRLGRKTGAGWYDYVDGKRVERT